MEKFVLVKMTVGGIQTEVIEAHGRDEAEKMAEDAHTPEEYAVMAYSVADFVALAEDMSALADEIEPLECWKCGDNTITHGQRFCPACGTCLS